MPAKGTQHNGASAPPANVARKKALLSQYQRRVTCNAPF